MLWFQFVRGKLDFRQRATNKTNSLQLYFLHNFWSRTMHNTMLCWEQNFSVHQNYVGIQIHVHNLIWHIRPIPMACVANISSPSFHWNKVGKADDARLWAEYFIRRSNIKHRQFGENNGKIESYYIEWGNRFDRGKCVNEFLLSKNADAQKLLAIFLLLFSAVCLEKQPNFLRMASLMLAWSADQ